MYQPGQGKSTVRFSLRPGRRAGKVFLAGDFSSWQLLQMRNQGAGAFVRNVSVPVDVFQYKFVVDGRWIADPDHADRACNPYGSLNSVGRLAKESARGGGPRSVARRKTKPAWRRRR